MGQQGQCQHNLLSRTDYKGTRFRGEVTTHLRLLRTRPRRRKQYGRRCVASHSPARTEISFSLLLTLSTEQALAYYKRQLNTMLINKQSLRVSRLPSSRKKLLPGAKGGTSAAGCKYTQTSKTVSTPFPSSKFPLSVSVPHLA